MTNHDQLPTGSDIIKDHGLQLDDLIASMTKITQRHAALASNEMILLPEAELDKLIKATTRYVEFEFSQYPDLMNVDVTVNGTGLVIIADKDNVALGSERLYEGDEVTGTIMDVSTIPVPSATWLHEGDGTEDTYNDEVLAPALVLGGATLKADPMPDGDYESVADLADFYLFLPLAHYLRIVPTRS